MSGGTLHADLIKVRGAGSNGSIAEQFFLREGLPVSQEMRIGPGANARLGFGFSFDARIGDAIHDGDVRFSGTGSILSGPVGVRRCPPPRPIREQRHAQDRRRARLHTQRLDDQQRHHHRLRRFRQPLINNGQILPDPDNIEQPIVIDGGFESGPASSVRFVITPAGHNTIVVTFGDAAPVGTLNLAFAQGVPLRPPRSTSFISPTSTRSRPRSRRTTRSPTSTPSSPRSQPAVRDRTVDITGDATDHAAST